MGGAVVVVNIETAKSTRSTLLSGNWRTSPAFTSNQNVRSAVTISDESVSLHRELPAIDRRHPMHDGRKSEEFESRAGATDAGMRRVRAIGTGQALLVNGYFRYGRRQRWTTSSSSPAHTLDGSGALPVREVEASACMTRPANDQGGCCNERRRAPSHLRAKRKFTTRS